MANNNNIGAQSQMDSLIGMNDLKELLEGEFLKITKDPKDKTYNPLQYTRALTDLYNKDRTKYKGAIDWRDMPGSRQHELHQQYPGGDVEGIMGFLQRLLPGGKTGYR